MLAPTLDRPVELNPTPLVSGVSILMRPSPACAIGPPLTPPIGVAPAFRIPEPETLGATNRIAPPLPPLMKLILPVPAPPLARMLPLTVICGVEAIKIAPPPPPPPSMYGRMPEVLVLVPPPPEPPISGCMYRFPYLLDEE